MEHLILGMAVGALFVLLWRIRVEVRQRRRAEGAQRDTAAALRLHEERLELALEASEDGLWDWNMRTGEVYFSPRLLALLGFAEGELEPRLDAWLERLHPADKTPIRRALEIHLAGQAPHFAAECRLRTRDDRWVWHLVRGKVVERDDHGMPTRAVGTHADISERKQAEGLLRDIAAGTAPVTGADFFRRLVAHLANALGVRYAYVAELIAPARVRSVALWANGGFGENIEYDLAGTPCEGVVGSEMRLYPSGVQQRFPTDDLLVSLNAEAYLGVPLFAAEGTPLGLLAVVHDKPLEHAPLTETILSIFSVRAGAELERQRINQSLFQAKELAEVTLRSIGDGVITTDAEGRVDYLNPVAETLTGWRLDQARGELFDTVFTLVDEQTRERLPSPVARCLLAGQTITLSGQSVLINRAGREYAVQDSVAPIRGRDGRVLGIVLTFSDASETRRMTRQMAHQATHDALTGLVNRLEFEQRLERALASTRGSGLVHALCYMDLDRFKIVNDSAGHGAGDELLKQVAALLQGRVRARDTLARVGGDEFSLLLENCPLDKAREIATLLIDVIREFRFFWRGEAFEIGISIGLVPITAAIENTAQALTWGDVACYAAKDLGRNRVHVYDPADGELSQRRSEIHRAATLAKALADDRFNLYGQAIVPLAASEETRSRYEILLRLIDAQGQVIAADAFISAAERYGLMASIDRWVISTALRRYNELWGEAKVEIALNLSVRSLTDDMLLFIRQQLAECGVPAERFCFEINESATIGHLNQAIRFVTTLKSSGCRFALDVFGGALSSLAHLKELPVDYLIIDGDLVSNSATDPVAQAMVETINRIGKIMGIRTIAEHVENDTTLERLKRLGVDYGQGYALGYPAPLETLGGANTPIVATSGLKR